MKIAKCRVNILISKLKLKTWRRKMLGLGLAALYWLFLYLTGTVGEVGYYYATEFLFRWYCFWLVGCVFFSVFLVGIASWISAAVKEEIQKNLGKAVAFITGTALSISGSLLFCRFCFAAGAYFLHSALIVRGDAYAYLWDSYRLFLGAGLWLTGWIISKR